MDGFTPDGLTKLVRLDSSLAVAQIDIVHYQIHRGKAFIYPNYDIDVDIAVPKFFRLTAPAAPKQVHLSFDFQALTAGTVEFYEDPTLTGQGSTVVGINLNRNSALTAGMTIGEDATQSALGTLIWQAPLVTGQGFFTTSGGKDGTRQEIILKYAEEYLIRFVTVADNNTLRTQLLWYEI